MTLRDTPCLCHGVLPELDETGKGSVLDFETKPFAWFVYFAVHLTYDSLPRHTPAPCCALVFAEGRQRPGHPPALRYGATSHLPPASLCHSHQLK
jgi:hypothetical protein